LSPYSLSTDLASGINGGHPYPKGSERKDKKAMNPESVVLLAHGLRLVVSTLQEEDQAFRCRVFEVNVREEVPLAYRVISDGFEAVTCLEAQTGAYNYAKRVYPAFADRMKKPPYLIWPGPSRGL
jgi:hypothetical protein